MNIDQIARDAFDDLVRGLPSSRLRRLREPITWSETIDGDMVQFEASILEDEPMWLSVDASVMVIDPARAGRGTVSAGYNGPVVGSEHARAEDAAVQEELIRALGVEREQFVRESSLAEAAFHHILGGLPPERLRRFDEDGMCWTESVDGTETFFDVSVITLPDRTVKLLVWARCHPAAVPPLFSLDFTAAFTGPAGMYVGAVGERR